MPTVPVNFSNDKLPVTNDVAPGPAHATFSDTENGACTYGSAGATLAPTQSYGVSVDARTRPPIYTTSSTYNVSPATSAMPSHALACLCTAHVYTARFLDTRACAATSTCFILHCPCGGACELAEFAVYHTETLRQPSAIFCHACLLSGGMLRIHRNRRRKPPPLYSCTNYWG